MTSGCVLFNKFTTVQIMTHEQICLWSKKTIKVTPCVFLLYSISVIKGCSKINQKNELNGSVRSSRSDNVRMSVRSFIWHKFVLSTLSLSFWIRSFNLLSQNDIEYPYPYQSMKIPICFSTLFVSQWEKYWFWCGDTEYLARPGHGGPAGPVITCQ